MASTHVLIRDSRTDRLWTIARWSAMAAVPLLLIWLVVDPPNALNALWYIAIPVLPATFFLNTILWRGVCPLATLNEWGNRLGRQRALPDRTAAALGVAGLALFHLLVPARRFLFNENGTALAATVLAVGILALALGAVFVVRSAFCNALCPVLPIELLYGQRPLLRMNRGRCGTCTVCTSRGCLDLAQGKATSQVLGARRRSAAWLTTPYGAFVAALPGFIIGYSLLADGSLASAGVVYATTLGLSGISYAIIAALVLALRLDSRMTLPLLAGLAGGLYYWFAGPAIARALAVPAWTGPAIQVAGMGLVAFWLVAALRGNGARRQHAEAILLP